MLKQAQHLQPGDMIDLEPYWKPGTVDSSLSYAAQYQFFTVESVKLSPNGVQCVVYLVNAPSNVICERTQEFELGNDIQRLTAVVQPGDGFFA